MSGLETLFDQARGISSPAERSAFLDRACGANAELRREIEELLLAHDRAEGFLQVSAIRRASHPNENTSGESSAESAGAVVGNYKLLEQIGEGGMGIIFMAEQFRPVKRRVAMKIIKPGMDTRQVIARFDAERQALAMMDHPNIARVFDAGVTETGRPYFAMELVRGIPITQFCDEERLAPRQRLELFIQVCQAVQHAHQKGIIHRDLKPTNVLVTLADDGKPVPKIIDFGIAKATGGQRLVDQTLFTEFRQLIGTPLYMSPEQAERSAVQDVDTRSDVYSLGVLLYELLTGTTPFAKERLAQAAYDEVRRIIREEDPPKPSTRLSTLGASLTAISQQRNSDPKELGQTIRGELDWIVMKALAKERARRYETANGLARDVERYLADQPVEACPLSRRYRFGKFARRNKSVLATAAAMFAVLSIATAISLWQARRANRLAAAALIQRDRADREAATATKVADYLQQMVSLASYGSRDKDESLRYLLNKLGERLNEGLENDPQVEAELRLQLAEKYMWYFRDPEKAELHTRRSAELYRRLGGEDDDKYANSLADHAFVLWTSGRGTPGQAVAEAQKAVTIFRKRGIRDGRFIFALHSLIDRLHEAHRFSEVKPVRNELLNIFRADPRHQIDADELAADMAADEHDLPTAEMFYRRAYQARNNSARGDVITHHFANVLTTEQKFAEAIEVRQTAVTLSRRQISADNQFIAATLNGLTNDLQCAQNAGALAATFHSFDELAAIEAIYRESLSVQPVPPRITNPRIAAVKGLARLADVYAALGSEPAAKPLDAGLASRKSRDLFSNVTQLYQSLIEQLAKSVAPADPDLVTIRVDYVDLLARLGRFEEATAVTEDLLKQVKDANVFNQLAWDRVAYRDPCSCHSNLSVSLARRAVQLAPNKGDFRNTLGVALYRSGDYAGAIESLDQSRKLQSGSNFAWDAFFLAMSHWQLGHQAEARQWFDQAIAWMEKNQPNNEELVRFRAEAQSLMVGDAPATGPAATVQSQ